MNSQNTFLTIVVILALALFNTGCEKEVNISLPNSQTQNLVVEGGIETDGPPLVLLTRSFGFFSKVDLSTLQNAFVHGATVTVSDGNKSIQLREYTLDTTGQSSFSIYTIDTANPAHFTFLGQRQHTYHLKVEVDGQTYESDAFIPNGKGLDSIWSATPADLPANNADVRQIYVKYTDPDTFGNCVRYYTSRNNGPFYPGLGSVYNDEVINGATINLALSAGAPPGGDFNIDSTGYFYRGDTVTVKWSGIDKIIYNFWSNFEYAVFSTGNPFAAPINVKSNMSNGALGVWAGYDPKYYNYIIPK